MEILLRVSSLVPDQSGPARILTFSLDPYERNLTVGQEGPDLVLRLRTAWTDANGTIDGGPVAIIPRVFLTSDWVDLGILIEPGRLRMIVGGEPVVDKALPPRPLETWDPSHRLALGNELTGNRPWLGEIRRAVVRAGESAEDYADTRELDFPRIGIFGRREGTPKIVPLRDLKTRDALENLILYIPLGVLVGFLVGDESRVLRWRLAFGALVVVLAASASIEMLQVFVPRRAPSLDDVTFNTIGGGLGLLLGLWARREFGPALRL